MSNIKLVAVGDVSVGDHYFTLGHGLGTRMSSSSADRTFSEVKDIIASADISILNLEGPISDQSNRKPPVESCVFRGPVCATSVLKRAGFNVIHVANNHIMQHGIEAFQDTIRHIGNAQIGVIGLKGGQGFYSKPLIENIRGARVGMLGYSQVSERYQVQQECYANCTDTEVIADIKKLKASVDVVIVSTHCGTEGAFYPTNNEVVMLRSYIDAGAAVVLGHHAHVMQPVEKYRNGIIAHNLGDFVFDLFWDKSYVESSILNIEIRPEKTGQVAYASLIPVCFQKNYCVSLLKGKRKSLLVDRIREDKLSSFSMCDSKQLSNFGASIRNIFMQYRKVIFFISQLLKGHTKLKIIFLLNKAGIGK